MPAEGHDPQSVTGDHVGVQQLLRGTHLKGTDSSAAEYSADMIVACQHNK
jgi:hypothetical protein